MLFLLDYWKIMLGILIFFLISFFPIWEYIVNQKLPDLSNYNKNYKITIIGAGFSGILAGIKLKAMGLTNFIIYDQEEEIGGTWYKNSYPGCECDVRSHLYSYSFELNPKWKKRFPLAKDIQQYIVKVSQKYGLLNYIQLNTQILSQKYDEKTNMWSIQILNKKTQQVQENQSNFIISGLGAISIPNIPNLKGNDIFQGKQMHTGAYDPNYNFENKNIAIIGSAASAIQAAPAMAKTAKNIYLFQRSANYIIPKQDKEFSNFTIKLFEYLPFLMKYYRYFLFLYQEHFYIAFKFQTIAKYFTKDIIQNQMLPKMKNLSKETQKQLIPDYDIGCKRILLSDNYYQMYQQKNVQLITDPLVEFTQNSIITKNSEFKNIDCILYATGFKTNDFSQEVIGKNNISLKQQWKKDSSTSFKATLVPNFPNLITMGGPHTSLGHNSIVFQLECQMEYIINLLEYVITNGIQQFECTQEAFQQNQKQIIQKEQNTVWIKGGCNNWYKDANNRVSALHIGFSTEFWLKMRKSLNLKDYIFQK